MTEITPLPSKPTQISVAQYLELIESGVLAENDRVELLEGVIVSMAPSDPLHATSVTKTTLALIRAVADRAAVRPQCDFVASDWSVPVPDIAVVAGEADDYARSHPRRAILLVEISDSSLKQDRLSKSRIYAAARIPEYWIVNLRDHVVEIMRDPDPATAVYRDIHVAHAGEELELAALPGARVAVADLLPKRT